MDSKFTVMANEALKLAKKTARTLKLNYVGTEHILMGLILEDGCVASRILIDNGIDESRMMDMIRDLIVPDSNVRTLDRDGFSPRAEKVLEEAHRMAEGARRMADSWDDWRMRREMDRWRRDA